MRPRHIGAGAMSIAQAALGDAADGGGTLPGGYSGPTDGADAAASGADLCGASLGSREARKNWPLQRFNVVSCVLSARGYLTPVLLLGLAGSVSSRGGPP